MSERWRIGSLDGDDALSDVLGVAVAPTGELYVAQSFVPHVSVFSAEGKFLHNIGRAGQGPGEFDLGPLRLGWRGDSLWVSDFSSVQFFSPDGFSNRQVEFSVRVRADGSRFSPGVPLADGTYLGARSVAGDLEAFFGATHLAIPRFSDQGEIVDTLAVPAQRRIVHLGKGFTDHPLSDWRGLSWLPFDVAPDGQAILMIGDIRAADPSPSFDLLKLGVAGDTLASAQISYEPLRISRSDANWLTEAFAARQAGEFASGRMTSQRDDAARARAKQAALESISFPEYFPPVRRIVASADGSLWILRELRLPDQLDRWEQYDATLQFRGAVHVTSGQSSRIPWKPRMEILAADRHSLIATTVDEVGVPHLHNFVVDGRCR